MLLKDKLTAFAWLLVFLAWLLVFLSRNHVGPDEYFSSSWFVFVEFLVTFEIILNEVHGMKFKQTNFAERPPWPSG